MKFYLGDLSLLIITALLILFLSIFAYGGTEGTKMLRVESGEESWLYPLDQDTEFTVPGVLGDLSVVVKDGKVEVKEAPCKEQICVVAKPISDIGDWNACLPSTVFLSIVGDSSGETDEFAF